MSREDRSTEDEALYRQARRRYALKRGLATHTFIFVVVNAGLIALNLLTAPHALWFVFPLFGWSIGLLAHALSVWHVLAGGRERGIDAEFRRLKAQRDGA